MNAHDVHEADQAAPVADILHSNGFEPLRVIIGGDEVLYVSGPRQLLYKATHHQQDENVAINQLASKERLTEHQGLGAIRAVQGERGGDSEAEKV